MTKAPYILILSSLVLMMLTANSVFAIGISPAIMWMEDVLPESSVEKTAKISRSDTSTATILSLRITGKDKDYVHLPLGEELVMEVGTSSIEFPVTIKPGKLAEGTYSALLTVSGNEKMTPTENTSTEETQAGTSMVITTGTTMNIIFDVTNDNIESYLLDGCTIPSSEVKRKLSSNFRIINSGNVDTRPGKIDFTFIDTKDSSNTFLATVEASEIPITNAFKQQTVTIVLPYMDFRAGNYRATAVFHDKDGEIIYTEEKMPFQIFPEGTLAQKGELNSFTSDKTYYEDGEVVQLAAKFKNTGTIGTEATFVTEIYKDDTRVDIIKQDPLYIPVGQETEFTQDYNPIVGGSYTAKAYVQYGIFKTEVLETSFKVDVLSPWIIVGSLGGVCALIGGFLFWRHHKKSGAKATKKIASKKKK